MARLVKRRSEFWSSGMDRWSWVCAVAVVKDSHEAEDAFQATFLVLVRRADSIRCRDTIGPWLHGVATRVARRAFNRTIRRRKRELSCVVDFPCRDSSSPDGPACEQVIQDEIARLPESFRAPVVLCCLLGLSYDLAARQLGLSEPTLRGRLHRARKQLAARLRAQGIASSVVGPAIEPFRVALPALPSSLVESTVPVFDAVVGAERLARRGNGDSRFHHRAF